MTKARSHAAMRVVRIIAIVVATSIVMYLAALVGVRGPVAVYRMLSNGAPNVDTWHIFPQRPVDNGSEQRPLRADALRDFPETVTFPDLFDPSRNHVARWSLTPALCHQARQLPSQ